MKRVVAIGSSLLSTGQALAWHSTEVNNFWPHESFSAIFEGSPVIVSSTN